MKRYFAIILLIISSIGLPLSTFADSKEKPKDSPEKENAETALNYDDTKKLFENNENKSPKTAQPLEKPVPTTNTFTNSYFFLTPISSTQVILISTSLVANNEFGPLFALGSLIACPSFGYRSQSDNHGYEISFGIPRITSSYMYFNKKNAKAMYYGLGGGITSVTIKPSPPRFFLFLRTKNISIYPKIFLGYQNKEKNKHGSFFQLDILPFPTISYGICF
jgi:hypothetical protein